MFAIKDVPSFKIYDAQGNFINEFGTFNTANVFSVDDDHIKNIVELYSEVFESEFLKLYYGDESRGFDDFDSELSDVECEFTLGNCNKKFFKFIADITLITYEGEIKKAKLVCPSFKFGQIGTRVSAESLMLSCSEVTEKQFTLTCVEPVKITIYK